MKKQDTILLQNLFLDFEIFCKKAPSNLILQFKQSNSHWAMKYAFPFIYYNVNIAPEENLSGNLPNSTNMLTRPAMSFSFNFFVG